MSTVERPAAQHPVPSATVVDGHRVGVSIEGEGEPLVLIHGIGRDRADWATVLPALAERFTVYAIDVEGFGESEVWGAAVTLRSMARMVRRTVEALGETRPLRLVGNSMGGAIALRMVADDPTAFAGLVLISPAGFGREATFGLRALTVPVLGPALLRAASTPAYVRMQGRLGEDSPDVRALEVASSRRLRRPHARRSYLQVIHDLGAWSGIREEWRGDVLAALADSRVPVLVLWGDRDSVLPHAHLGSVADAVPHAETRSLTGLGHMPQLEAPERTAREIAAFLTLSR